jgi:hypothetical protein
MSRQTVGCFILVLIGLCLAAAIFYQIPPIKDRLGWRVEALQARLRYAINPPEQAVFVPAGQPLPDLASQLPTATPAAALTTIPSLTTPLPGPTETPSPTATPVLTPTPLPAQVLLGGITHMYQSWNNCGPANLAMALSFWGWQGDQDVVGPVINPDPKDKNVIFSSVMFGLFSSFTVRP